MHIKQNNAIKRSLNICLFCDWFLLRFLPPPNVSTCCNSAIVIFIHRLDREKVVALLVCLRFFSFSLCPFDFVFPIFSDRRVTGRTDSYCLEYVVEVWYGLSNHLSPSNFWCCWYFGPHTRVCCNRIEAKSHFFAHDSSASFSPSNKLADYSTWINRISRILMEPSRNKTMVYFLNSFTTIDIKQPTTGPAVVGSTNRIVAISSPSSQTSHLRKKEFILGRSAVHNLTTYDHHHHQTI